MVPSTHDRRLKLLMALGALFQIFGYVLWGSHNAGRRAKHQSLRRHAAACIATVCGMAIAGVGCALAIVPGQPDMLRASATTPPSNADVMRVAQLWLGMYNGGIAVGSVWAWLMFERFAVPADGLLAVTWTMIAIGAVNFALLSWSSGWPVRGCSSSA
jgi:hypothetical protein